MARSARQCLRSFQVDAPRRIVVEIEPTDAGQEFLVTVASGEL